mmetsp:Transcript_945/g.2922  ORF Transcript_945/g.2922 Transcript_945/m.2922 type:complete len:242 (+) Transcript_945:352-1077(+)
MQSRLLRLLTLQLLGSAPHRVPTVGRVVFPPLPSGRSKLKGGDADATTCGCRRAVLHVRCRGRRAPRLAGHPRALALGLLLITLHPHLLGHLLPVGATVQACWLLLPGRPRHPLASWSITKGSKILQTSLLMSSHLSHMIFPSGFASHLHLMLSERTGWSALPFTGHLLAAAIAAARALYSFAECRRKSGDSCSPQSSDAASDAPPCTPPRTPSSSRGNAFRFAPRCQSLYPPGRLPPATP